METDGETLCNDGLIRKFRNILYPSKEACAKTCYAEADCAVWSYYNKKYIYNKREGGWCKLGTEYNLKLNCTQKLSKSVRGTRECGKGNDNGNGKGNCL